MSFITFGPQLPGSQPNTVRYAWMRVPKKQRLAIAKTLDEMQEHFQGKYLPVSFRVALSDAAMILKQDKLMDLEDATNTK